MSTGNSIERARMMSALGAEVILVNQLPGSIPGQVSGGDLELVEQEAQRIARARGAFRAVQFHQPGNWRAYYLHTGPEILRQTGGSLHAFCDFVGTAGSFAGCAAAFKEYDKSIQCFAVEVAGAAVLAGEASTKPNHRIQGGGYSMPTLPLLTTQNIDGYIQVPEEEAIRTTRRLAKEEGLFAGYSSGINVAAALQLIADDYRGRTVVVLLCDSGLKYLSTDLWQ
jgi:cysteine synthase A